MTMTPFLDDPKTPGKLRELRDDLAIAVDREDRGHAQCVRQEIRRLCASLRAEIGGLRGRADPDLLIALWSTSQMTHARGVEYAHGGPRIAPAAEEAQAMPVGAEPPAAMGTMVGEAAQAAHDGTSDGADPDNGNDHDPDHDQDPDPDTNTDPDPDTAA